jgi:hypothetical protein
VRKYLITDARLIEFNTMLITYNVYENDGLLAENFQVSLSLIGVPKEYVISVVKGKVQEHFEVFESYASILNQLKFESFEEVKRQLAFY